jgi:hypothetical protein
MLLCYCCCRCCSLLSCVRASCTTSQSFSIAITLFLLLLLSLLQPVELREGFLHDLNPESPGFPHTLGELAERLKAWRNRLTTELEAAMPHSLRLEEECRALQVSGTGHMGSNSLLLTYGWWCI